MFNWKINKSIVPQISLFLLVFQSCGIRYFSGISYVIAFIIILLNWKTLFRFNLKDVVRIAVICSIIIVWAIGNYGPPMSVLYFTMCLLMAYLVLMTYREFYSLQKFRDDFYAVLGFFCMNALIGFILYLFISPLFWLMKYELLYNTFFYIFNVSYNIGILGLCRNTGLFWEPGILQFFVNLYLFLAIVRHDCSWRKMLMLVFLVLTTNSTAGFLVLLIVLVYYFFVYQKLSVKYLVLAAVVGSAFLPVLIDNVQEKTVGEHRTSGRARQRDALIAGVLLADRPIWGHGFFDREYLVNQTFIEFLEDELFGVEYIDENIFMSGGYTNGFLHIFIIWGIPMGLLIYGIFIFKNRVVVKIRDKLFFGIICFLSFISEPITNTSFFMLIFLSGLVISKKQDEPESALSENGTSVLKEELKELPHL